MTDLDAVIRSSLEQWVPQRDSDWSDVVARAGVRGSRRPLIVAAIVAAALVVGAAAVAETIGHGFSDWLEGAPGTPASPDAQMRLQDRRTFAPFDGEVDVRELLSVRYAGRTYRLIGFRTGGAVCLRLSEAVVDEGGDVSCLPGDQLVRSNDLAAPLAIDKPLTDPGPGAAPGPQASFGLVAAEAERVVLDGDDGPREALVGNGAFLLLGPRSVPEHTTLRGYAVDREGRRRTIPVAPALGAEIGQFRTGLPLLGPKTVERQVDGGEIGWLARREPRGEPLPQALRAILRPHPRPPSLPASMPGPVGIEHDDFARLVQPDPADFMRVVVARTTAGATCYYEVARGGVGGTCLPADRLFRKLPFTPGWGYAGVGTQFLTVSGIASDAVARLDVFLGNGDVQRISLRDNAYVGRIQRAKLPGRLVAYDDGGRVIGVWPFNGG